MEIHKRDPATGKKIFHSKVLGHLSLKHAAVSCGLADRDFDPENPDYGLR